MALLWAALVSSTHVVQAHKATHLCNLTLEPNSLVGPDGCLAPIAKHNDTIRKCWYETMTTDYEMWVDQRAPTHAGGLYRQALVAVPAKSCYSESMRDVHLECTWEFPMFVDELPNACSGIAGVMRQVEGINELRVWVAFYSYVRKVGSELKKVVQTQIVHRQRPFKDFVCSATYQVSGACLGVTGAFTPPNAVPEPPPLPPNTIFPGVDVNGQERPKLPPLRSYQPAT